MGDLTPGSALGAEDPRLLASTCAAAIWLAVTQSQEGGRRLFSACGDHSRPGRRPGNHRRRWPGYELGGAVAEELCQPPQQGAADSRWKHWGLHLEASKPKGRIVKVLIGAVETKQKMAAEFDGQSQGKEGGARCDDAPICTAAAFRA